MDAEHHLPLPRAFYQRYMWFWHVVTGLSFAGLLSAAVLSRWGNFDVTSALAVVLTLGLMALYIRFYVFVVEWPQALWKNMLYFGGGMLTIFLLAPSYPNYLLLIWMMFGQAFGMLQGVSMALTTLALMVTFAIASVNGQLSELNPNWLWLLTPWIGGIMLHLFIARLIQTSQERGQLIHELEQTKQALQAALYKDVELAALRERERIARDMHDNLGHSLVALAVQLEAVQRLYRVDPQRASHQIDQLKQLTRDSMAVLRRTLEGVRAAGLGDRPLSQALQQLCIATAQSANLDIRCAVSPQADQLDHDVADALWSLTQEALTNVQKHAQARHVQVQLQVQSGAVILDVHDDGVGINASPEQPINGPSGKHFGLQGMHERVTALGGSLQVQRDTGTRVIAQIPISLESRKP